MGSKTLQPYNGEQKSWTMHFLESGKKERTYKFSTSLNENEDQKKAFSLISHLTYTVYTFLLHTQTKVSIDHIVETLSLVEDIDEEKVTRALDDLRKMNLLKDEDGFQVKYHARFLEYYLQFNKEDSDKENALFREFRKSLQTAGNFLEKPNIKGKHYLDMEW